MIPPFMFSVALDFDQRFGRAQRPHFDERRSRKIAAEVLTPRAPNFGVLLDIDHVDGHLDDVVEAGARTFADQFDAREDLLSLFVLVAAHQRLAAFERTCHLTGDEEEIAGANAV
jgi:hypothetical protein